LHFARASVMGRFRHFKFAHDKEALALGARRLSPQSRDATKNESNPETPQQAAE
jgi:hypothetical protein